MTTTSKKTRQAKHACHGVAPMGHPIYGWLASIDGYYAVTVLSQRDITFEEIAEIFQVEPHAIESVVFGN